MHHDVHRSLIYKCQDMETTKESINRRWRETEDVVPTHTQWNTTQPQKEWNFAICNNIDGLKWNKSNKDKYCIALLFGI